MREVGREGRRARTASGSPMENISPLHMYVLWAEARPSAAAATAKRMLEVRW
jgi:hypothetical protein